MDLVILFGVGLSTGLSGAMIPGPLMLYTVSEAFRTGQFAGLKIAAGHLLLEAGFAFFVIIGLRDFLSSAAFRTAMVWTGSVGLVMMGALVLTKLARLSLVHGSSLTSRRVIEPGFRWGPVAGGAFFSLSSPGFIIWWATIGTSIFLKASAFGMAGIAAMALGHAAADLGWCWLVAFSVERGTAYCSNRTYRTIMALIALGLIGLGLGLPVVGLGTSSAGVGSIPPVL